LKAVIHLPITKYCFFIWKWNLDPYKKG